MRRNKRGKKHCLAFKHRTASTRKSTFIFLWQTSYCNVVVWTFNPDFEVMSPEGAHRPGSKNKRKTFKKIRHVVLKWELIFLIFPNITFCAFILVHIKYRICLNENKICVEVFTLVLDPNKNIQRQKFTKPIFGLRGSQNRCFRWNLTIYCCYVHCTFSIGT